MIWIYKSFPTRRLTEEFIDVHFRKWKMITVQRFKMRTEIKLALESIETLWKSKQWVNIPFHSYCCIQTNSAIIKSMAPFYTFPYRLLFGNDQTAPHSSNFLTTAIETEKRPTLSKCVLKWSSSSILVGKLFIIKLK